MNENKYTNLIEELIKFKEMLIDIDFLDVYTRSKLDKVIEILSSNNYNKNEEKMMFVKDYLSEKDLFHPRGIIDLLMPLGKINVLGEHWFDYFYKLEKLCKKTLDNAEENIILSKCDTTTNYIKIHIGRHHYLISNSYIKYAQAYKPFIKVDIDKIIEKLKAKEDLIGIKEFKIIKISDRLEKTHLEELLKIVSNWEKSYLNHLIKDGLHWGIKVVYDNIDFYTYGFNKFPDNWDKLTVFLESILQDKENKIEFLYEDTSIEKITLPEDNSLNNEDLDKYISMILNEITDIMEYQAIDIIKDTIKYCNINKINTISRIQNQDNSLKTLEINTDNGLYYIEIDSNNIIQIIRETSLDGNIIYRGGLDALFED